MEGTVIKEFLNPARKLVDEVVDWLCRDKHMRQTEGAHSLAHLLVVVPTAQSGRNLRLALAKKAAANRWGGIIPPTVVQPMQLVQPADPAEREATSAEAAAAFQQYVKAHRAQMLTLDCLIRAEEFDDLTARFALFDQLQDIWRALAGRGYLMQDVLACQCPHLEADWADERRRWQQLADLEQGYFDFLHTHGLMHPVEAVHRAKSRAAIVAAEISEIVLPALADPLRVVEDVLRQQLAAGKRITVLVHANAAEADRFDAWGLPKVPAWTGGARPVLNGLADEDIICAPNASQLAKIVAADFPQDPATSLPTLALCDETLFQSVASGFLNRGYIVHNPERHALVRSSLGRLIRHLMALYVPDEIPWREFVAILRSADVQRALGLTAARRSAMLAGADAVQNTYIPNTVPANLAFPVQPDIHPQMRKDMEVFLTYGRAVEAKLADCRRDASLGRYLRRALEWIFAAHALGQGADDREFMAAATAARDFLQALEGDLLASLPMTTSELLALARRELEAANYSLEEESADVLKTEGWLELAWSPADRVALVGFHDGKVPDSVIGHPFLPDALRAELGLVTNEDRLARDTWILKELLAARPAHAVRAYIARASDAGDICRPSRLLYLCADGDLARRVDYLFGELAEERQDKVRRVEWALRLPDEVAAPAHYSPSRIDTYVKCPFTYLLKYGLGMRPYREKRELEANDFGTLVHAALEAYARRQIARGDDQLTDAREIRRVLVEEIMPELTARYGKMTLNLTLQLKAVEGRLALFAAVQAEWAQAGWRIRQTEHPVDADITDLGFRIRGTIDRVDENIRADAEVRRCLIDYKTWDEKQLTHRVFTSGKPTEKSRRQLDFAHRLGFPAITVKGEERQRMLSVQLPLYGRGLAAAEGLSFAEMCFAYLILGPNARETGFCKPLTNTQVEGALATAKRAVELIEKNVFWPPGPSDEWKWDFAGLFVADPQRDLADTAWVRTQLARLEALHV
ncbi:MAG: PD-(D/E)XK nuclease family protein [Kiritimatiellia bacterium]